MIYNLTARHSDPEQSVQHYCFGHYEWSDPTQCWQDSVDADSPEEAAEIGRRHLEENVAEEAECRCGRGRAGTKGWWASVVIEATPCM